MRKHLPIAFNLSCLAVVFAGGYGYLPIGCIPVGLVAWFLLGAPLAVYALTERPLASDVFEVLPDDMPTTEGSDAWARSVAEQLKPHGFVARARYRIRTGPLAGEFDFAQRLDNDLTGEVAMLVAGWQRPPKGAAIPRRSTIFYTCFRDGGELVTTNSPLPTVTPLLPGQAAYRIPEVTDADALYMTHQRLVRADLRKAKPVVPGRDPVAWECLMNQRAIAVHVAHGLGVRDEKAGVLRLTFKGALRATWLLHPVATHLHVRRSRRAVSAALRPTTA